MDTNKNFNPCCGGWERGRRKETLALQYSWYSSYLAVASPCYSFTEGFLIHPFFEGWMRLGWVFWYFPHTKAAGSFYRKQLGLTSLALRIWNPRYSHYCYWIEVLLSSLRTCQNLAKLSWWLWAPALPDALGKCGVFLLYQSKSFNSKSLHSPGSFRALVKKAIRRVSADLTDRKTPRQWKPLEQGSPKTIRKHRSLCYDL